MAYNVIVMRTIALALLLLVFSAGQANAHARLVRSEPTNGATVERADVVVLEFDSEVERRYAKFTLKLADGSKRVLKVAGSGLTARIELPLGDVSAGDYVLRWSVVSRDGHRIAGVLRFTIAE